jgi:SAM-dependent methyltransferase
MRFDLVLCLGVMMHVAHEKDALREMARVLKPDGRLVVTFNNILSPFSLPYLIFAKSKKPEGYVHRFHTVGYYAAALADAGLSCEHFPGFLVPEMKWPEKSLPLLLRLNRLSRLLGYEPIIIARR